jgi:hypothetical protein
MKDCAVTDLYEAPYLTFVVHAGMQHAIFLGACFVTYDDRSIVSSDPCA